MDQPQIDALIHRIAFVSTDPTAQSALKQAFKHSESWSVAEWQALIDATEANGLSPLLYWHLQTLDIQRPALIDKLLKALMVRHRRAHQIRSQALIEILNAYQQAGIEVLLLKGVALAHLIYPDPSLRPMGDIDLLVSVADTASAQQALRDIGYAAAEYQQGYLSSHHHLPTATRTDAGMSIQVEVHHNALSGDVRASLAWHDLSKPVQHFDLMYTTEDETIALSAQTFNHADTLRHLCHHTFEPAERIKLISIVDLITYAHHFRHDIDWLALQHRYPFVINTLRCVHFLCPLPAALTETAPTLLSPPDCPTPDGLGKGFMPLSKVLAAETTWIQKVRQLLRPSPWWMHVFYHVAPENSLALTRWVRHPWQLSKWLLRRYVAARKSPS